MGLTPEQLSETGARTAFEAIEILRPGMLLRTGQYDGPGSPAPALAVYVDGVVQVGGIDVLRRIPVDWIASIRLIGPGDPRFPVGRGGAIAVVTRRAP